MANRSLALYQLKAFEDSLADIQLSLDLDYPQQLRAKLVKRQEACLAALATSTRKSTPPAPAIYQYVGHIEMFRDQGKGGGRAVRAKSAINCGDSLLIERAFTWLLLTKDLDTFCYHCLRRLTNFRPFACVHCNQVRYCSPGCQTASWTSGHERECTYIELLDYIDSGLFSARMVLSVFLRPDFKFEQLLNDRTPGCNGVGGSELAFKTGFQGFSELAQFDADTNNYYRIATFIVAFLLRGIVPVPTHSRCELITARDSIVRYIRRNQVNSMHLTYRELELDVTSGLHVFDERKMGCGLFLRLAMVS